MSFFSCLIIFVFMYLSVFVLCVLHLFLPGNIKLIYLGFVLFVCFHLIECRLISVMLASFGVSVRLG